MRIITLLAAVMVCGTAQAQLYMNPREDGRNLRSVPDPDCIHAPGMPGGYEVEVIFDVDREGRITGKPYVKDPKNTDGFRNAAEFLLDRLQKCQPYKHHDAYAKWHRQSVFKGGLPHLPIQLAGKSAKLTGTRKLPAGGPTQEEMDEVLNRAKNCWDFSQIEYGKIVKMMIVVDRKGMLSEPVKVYNRSELPEAAVESALANITRCQPYAYEKSPQSYGAWQAQYIYFAGEKPSEKSASPVPLPPTASTAAPDISLSMEIQKQPESPTPLPPRRPSRPTPEVKFDSDKVAALLDKSNARRAEQKQNTVQAVGDTFRTHVTKCWVIPANMVAPDVIVQVAFNKDGTIDGTPKLMNRKDTATYLRAAASVIEALEKCGPAPLPPEHYEVWRNMEILFRPNEPPEKK